MKSPSYHLSVRRCPGANVDMHGTHATRGCNLPCPPVPLPLPLAGRAAISPCRCGVPRVCVEAGVTVPQNTAVMGQGKGVTGCRSTLVHDIHKHACGGTADYQKFQEFCVEVGGCCPLSWVRERVPGAAEHVMSTCMHMRRKGLRKAQGDFEEYQADTLC